MLVRAEEPHELEDHDERTGRGLREAEAHRPSAPAATSRTATTAATLTYDSTAYAPPNVTSAALLKNQPMSVSVSPGPRQEATATMGSSHTARPMISTTTLRASDGLRVCGGGHVVAEGHPFVLLQLTPDADVERPGRDASADEADRGRAEHDHTGTARATRRSRRRRRPRRRPSGRSRAPSSRSGWSRHATIPITAAARPDSVALTHVTSPCAA